jgi:hypothetical protein
MALEAGSCEISCSLVPFHFNRDVVSAIQVNQGKITVYLWFFHQQLHLSCNHAIHVIAVGVNNVL